VSLLYPGNLILIPVIDAFDIVENILLLTVF
jgi:hypothetical protein